ncbi:MAG: hypothetical protein HC939_23400 [Pleurocapsa sp. SU_5_0]|nr:hypothetical protein [Pleurocapsa sp. SU_5_0]NJO98737.1 hypothetical protein [Pleurocapsa sp. CRU_1_2]NJR47717.1 hypothetical protein [Hyellaceae cyanobacterium CSU_1_1]
MTSSTESELRELKELILSQNEKLETKIDKLQKDVSNLKDELKEDITTLRVDVGKMQVRMDEWSNSIQKIPDLAEKVGELKNWRQIAVIVITGTVGTILGWIVRNGKY